MRSILEKGILSREKIHAEHVQHNSIADIELVEKRSTIPTPDGKVLWHYVNLFFWPCNPMLYRLIGTRATRDNLKAIMRATGQSTEGIEETIKEDLVILEIADTVLQEPGICITDGNAIAVSTQIYRLSESAQVFHQQQQIRLLTQPGPWISWKDESRKDDIILKNKLMAECLVPIQVDPKHIRKLFVADNNIANSVRARLNSIDTWRIEVKDKIFTRF